MTRLPAPSRSASTPGGRLGRGHHVVRPRLHPQLPQVLGHRVRWPRGVVGDEGDPHPRGPRRRHVPGRSGHRLRSDVDDAVEVEHRQVVAPVQGLVGTPQRPRGRVARRHRPSPHARRAMARPETTWTVGVFKVRASATRRSDGGPGVLRASAGRRGACCGRAKRAKTLETRRRGVSRRCWWMPVSSGRGQASCRRALRLGALQRWQRRQRVIWAASGAAMNCGPRPRI